MPQISLERGIPAALALAGIVTAAIGVGAPAAPWTQTVATVLWIALLVWINRAEEARSRLRNQSGALARGTGDMAGAPESREAWTGAAAFAAAFALTPQALLFLPGLFAGLARRAAWQAVGWRTAALGVASVIVLELTRPAGIAGWFAGGAGNPFEGPGSLPLVFLTLVLLGQVLFELYQLYKGPGLDRPGKLQSTFLAASCTFLLALSFGSPSLQRLTLWPTLVVSIGRAESLRQKKTALALLLFGVALLADRFLRLS